MSLSGNIISNMQLNASMGATGGIVGEIDLEGGSFPPGGLAGQVLAKQSDEDGDVDWETLIIPSTASEINFDNTGTGIEATDVQGAVVELNNNLINLTTFTSTEKVVGTWIDGKLIYKRIFTNLNITPSYNSWTVIADIPANVDKYVGTDLILCEGPNGNIDLSHSGLEITFSNSEGKIKIEYNQNANIRPINILSILYTKTTD